MFVNVTNHLPDFPCLIRPDIGQSTYEGKRYLPLPQVIAHRLSYRGIPVIIKDIILYLEGHSNSPGIVPDGLSRLVGSTY